MSRNLPYDRGERVADAIFEVVSGIVRTEVSDPRLAGVYVTRVSVTKDLRLARVCFHMEDNSDEKKALAVKGFQSARGLFKRRIGEVIKLRFMPDIKFYYDEGVDTKERIDELFEQIKTKK